MRSYIKIYGPPIMRAIKSLEKIAVNMPEVCIMDSMIARAEAQLEAQDFTPWIRDYFTLLPAKITVERCGNIISKSGKMLGDHDFFFEWFTDPSFEQLNSLIENAS